MVDVQYKREHSDDVDADVMERLQRQLLKAPTPENPVGCVLELSY